jgi:hypothetical protein
LTVGLGFTEAGTEAFEDMALNEQPGAVTTQGIEDHCFLMMRP